MLQGSVSRRLSQRTSPDHSTPTSCPLILLSFPSWHIIPHHIFTCLSIRMKKFMRTKIPFCSIAAAPVLKIALGI